MARTVTFDQMPVGETFLVKGPWSYTKVAEDAVRYSRTDEDFQCVRPADPFRAFVYLLPDDEA